MKQKELEDAGIGSAEAERASRRAMGNHTVAREDARGVWIWPWADHLIQDIRFALRMLRKNPGFTAVAVLTMALGVGVNSTMFSLVDYLMFRPPAHVQEPDRLVHLTSVRNYANVLNMQERSRSLDVAGYDGAALSLGRGADAQPVSTEFVSDNYFDVLGAAPFLGRWFLPEEETMTGLSPVVVLSHSLWRQRFDSDRAILGEGLWVSNGFYTVVGVAPRGFTGALVNPVDLWLPFSDNPAWGVALPLFPNGFYLHTIARIREVFTYEQARAEATGVELDGLPEVPAPALRIEPYGEVRLPLSNVQDDTIALWLTGAAAVVLLIASANVAGLLLVRVVERRHEVAVRIQLGAGRGRIFRQLLTESVVLATLAGAVALLFIYYSAPFVREFFVAELSGREVLDHRVLAVTGAFAMVTGLLAGLVPAIQTLRADVIDPLKSGQTGSKRAPWARRALLATQVTLTLVLLVAAGLFVGSVERVRQLDFGFDPENLLMVSTDFQKAGYSVTEANRIYLRLLERAERIPDVERAGLSTSRPMGGGTAGGFRPPEASNIRGFPLLHTITPDYLAALGMRMIQGRGLNAADGLGAPGVVIVSRRTAAHYWPDRNAVGQCLDTFSGSGCFEVVGVVENSRWRLADGESGPDEVYVPLAQSARLFPSVPAVRFLFVRTRGGSQSQASVLTYLRQTDSALPYLSGVSMWSAMDRQTRSWRLGASVFSLFGVLAAVLAGVGIYGVLAFSVRQRTSEVGIRMALGAERRDIFRLIAREGLAIIALGCLAGVLAAIGLTGFVESLLFGIKPTDTTALAIATAVIASVGLVACAVPAFTATRVDPAVALRHD